MAYLNGWVLLAVQKWIVECGLKIDRGAQKSKTSRELDGRTYDEIPKIGEVGVSMVEERVGRDVRFGWFEYGYHHKLDVYHHPERMASLSPGLRGTSYPGK
jgi:hypothetical protein